MIIEKKNVNVFFSSQDILETAISEKDSQIAELEMCGVLNEVDTKTCDALKLERDKLLERLKNEVRTDIFYI